jgi:hypothetical protein
VTTLEADSRAVVRFYNKKGRQAGREDDAALVPPIPGERGAARSERARLQSGELVAAAGAAEADRHVVTDEPAAAADPDGWPAREACAVLLAAAGGRTLDAATVRDDRAAACGAVGASEIAAPSLLPPVRPMSKVGVVSKKSVPTRPYRVLRVHGGHKRALGVGGDGPPDEKSQTGYLWGRSTGVKMEISA